ncbi:MAG TPA: 2-polyprenylphenol 6-hydroxylase [Micropepsaceae bacterium]|jgi:ubiquinone biosynthesis protein
MFGSVRKTRRLLRMARILAAHDALLPREYAGRAPRSLRILARLLGRPRMTGKTRPPGQRLSLALEQMGPSAIKLGQLLATRPDIMGAEIARGLETLQDRLPPFADAQARAIVEAELERSLDTVFSSFGPPVAAASIAQVHEAETTDDPPRRVAVKILRPGIEAQFVADFEGFRFAAKLGERFSAEARRLRLRTLVETLAASVALELDLRMEAAAASELAQNTRGDDQFRVPVLDWSRTSARVFTSEWVDGVVLRDPQTLTAAGHDPARIAVAVLRAFLTQALRDGFFHADMHPGNLFVDRAGRICAVDFGIMGRLEIPMRRFMAETLAGFLARDYMRVAQVHFDYGFVPKVHNVETFAQALRAVGEPIFGLTARDVSMARLLEQLFETTRRFDMPLQPQLVMLQKTMVVVEGVARSLDPAFDIWEASRPVIENWMIDNIGPEARLRDAADGLTSLGRLAQNIPQLLRDTELIASQLAGGGLRLHPDSVRGIATGQLRRTRHVRVALWIAAGALGIIALGLL